MIFLKSGDRSMDIDFDVSSLQEWIEERIEKVKDLDRVKEDIADVLLTSTQENFDNEQEPNGTPWEPLSTVTVEYKSRRDRYTNMLYDDGLLQGTIDTEINSKGVRVGSIKGNVPYARIHQKGGMAGRNHKVRIPARPYLGMNDKLRRKIKMIIKEHS